MGHVGFHPQKQAGPGLRRRGPAGGPDDCRADARAGVDCRPIRQRRPSPDRLAKPAHLRPPADDTEIIKAEIEKLGLALVGDATFAPGLVACTGNAGCKFAAANTKAHALLIADHLEARVQHRPARQHPPHRLPQFVCPALHRRHRPDRRPRSPSATTCSKAITCSSAAATGRARQIGRELYRDVLATDAPATIEKMLRGYLRHRSNETEVFQDFAKRHSIEQLQSLFAEQTVTP